MDSIPHTHEGANPPAGVEGAVTYRPTGPAAPGVPGLQDHQAAPGQPGPPLEPPPPPEPRPALQAALQAHRARCAAISARLAAAPPPPPPPERTPLQAALDAPEERRRGARRASLKALFEDPLAPQGGTAFDVTSNADRPPPATLGALGAVGPAGGPKAPPILDDSALTARALGGFSEKPLGLGATGTWEWSEGGILSGVDRPTPPAAGHAAPDLGALGQRVMVGPDGLPLADGQRTFDGTWTDPATVNGNGAGASFRLAPEPPELPEVAPRPPTQPQLALALPEPWHRYEPQLDLFASAFKYPTCTCRRDKHGHQKHTKRCQAQVRMTTAEFIKALALCWSYIVRCLEAHHVPPILVAYAARRAREVAVCCTKWKKLKCKRCEHFFNYQTTTPCHSRTCPVCGRKWSRKAMAAMFEYQKTHLVARDQGVLSRDYYMHTLTEQKPEFLTLKGLRASVYNVKKKLKDVWEKVVCNLPREPGWLDPEKYAAEKLRLYAAEQAAAELPCHERAAERRRLNAERKALWQSQRKQFPGKCPDAGMMGQVDLAIKGGVHVHALRYGAWHESDDVREAAGGTWTHDDAVRPKKDRTGVDFRGRNLAELDQVDAMRHAVCEVLKYICKTSTNPGTRGFIHPMLAVLFELATGPDAAATTVRMRAGYGSMKGIVAELDAKDEDGDDDEVPDKCPKCGCTELEVVFEDYSEPTMPQGGWCLRPTMWHPPPGGTS